MIVKIRKNESYELIPRATLQDDRLVMDELGLLCRLLSYPDGWEIRPYQLRKVTGWGRDRLRRVLRKLQETGYLRRLKIRTPNGSWTWVSELYAESQGIDFTAEKKEKKDDAEPSPDNKAMAGNPSLDDPSSDKPAYIDNTHQDNTDLDNTDHHQRDGGELDEYIRLGRRYGGRGGEAPADPDGWSDHVRKRIQSQLGGKLTQRDYAQLERWRELDNADPDNIDTKTKARIIDVVGWDNFNDVKYDLDYLINNQLIDDIVSRPGLDDPVIVSWLNDTGNSNLSDFAELIVKHAEVQNG